MRADRLLSIMLLLQTYRRMTASSQQHRRRRVPTAFARSIGMRAIDQHGDDRNVAEPIAGGSRRPRCLRSLIVHAPATKGGSLMMVILITLMTLILVLVIVWWAISPGLRAHIEQPKRQILPDIRAYEEAARHRNLQRKPSTLVEGGTWNRREAINK
jgi:hypothetical protein